MKTEFQTRFQEALREAETEDLKKHVEELNDAARSVSHASRDEKSSKTN
jgi:hypothetical protein